jgi:alpha,alpha-trehalase
MSSSNGQHRRADSSDPFSHPDVYYGEEEANSRIKDRRRAFSTVSSGPLETGQLKSTNDPWYIQ